MESNFPTSPLKPAHQHTCLRDAVRQASKLAHQHIIMPFKFLVFLALSFVFSSLSGQAPSKILLFVGTYTEGKPGAGIYIYEFNPSTGALVPTGKGKGLTNPSFLTISPDGKFLYACTDTKLPDSGGVSAFRIDSLQGKISFINKQASGGDNPVYLSVYKDNSFVVNANYTGGSISVFPVKEDGGLSPFTQLLQFTGSSIDKTRQEKAHLHAAVFSPAYDYLFAPDLGSDKIRVFKFDATNASAPMTSDSNTLNTIPGSGPRHFTFSPNGNFAYCIEELRGMITAYSYMDWKLDSIQRIFS